MQPCQDRDICGLCPSSPPQRSQPSCHAMLLLTTLLQQVGSVLLGNSRSRTFEFVNRGGDGRFLLLTAEHWAATLQQHGHSHDSVPAGRAAPAPAAAPAMAAAAEGVWEGPGAAAAALVPSEPFSVGPAYRDLAAGAAGVLTVEFSPRERGPQSAEYVLVCDNCTAHPLRVEGCGERVQVELVGVDGRPWLPQDAQVPLWFGQVSRLGQQVSVANCSWSAVSLMSCCSCACLSFGERGDVTRHR